MWYGILADATALLHGLLAAFIAGGVIVIVIGLWRRWVFVRGYCFRVAHLALSIVVLIFELANQPCPLTTLEQWLRELQAKGSAYENTFIGHYVSETIHVPVPPQSLAVPMSVFVALVVALYLWCGPAKLSHDDRPARE